MGSAIACCVKRADSETTAKEPLNRVLPSEDSLVHERERFMIGVDIVDEDELEPSFFSLSSFIPSAQRIASGDDVCSLEKWWGVGPDTPDRRLEAAMPKHTSVSYVEEVLVSKSLAIQELRGQSPILEKCTEECKYVLFQLKFGKASLLSLHSVFDNHMYERILNVGGGNLLRDKLKFIVTPVNLSVSVPSRGPRDAETVGKFFGKDNSYFSRPERRRGGDYDIAMVSIDLYSVWSLKMLLPSIAFRYGRMIDIHLVSYVDNAVLISYRVAMTAKVVELIKALETN